MGGAGSIAPFKLVNSVYPQASRLHVYNSKKSSTVFNVLRQGLMYPQECHRVEIRGQPAGVGSPLQPWGSEAGTQVVRPIESSYLLLKFFTNYICIERALLSSPLNSVTLV